MSEHQRNGKTFAQDVLGFFFCGIGAFFAVSIVLFLSGQESKEGLVELVTSPVLRLVDLLGAAAALLFSLGLTGLGTLLFLRTSAYAALRPLLSLAGVALGVALLLGALGRGGEAGAWLPGLVTGLAGKTLGVVLGLALAWLGWMSMPSSRPAGSHSVDALRIGLGARNDAAGVSPAEAALLGTEAGGATTRPAQRRPAPEPEEQIRPFTPSATPTSAAAATAKGGVASPARRQESDERVGSGASSSVREAPLFTPPPPAPSWEEPGDEPRPEPTAGAEAARVEAPAPEARLESPVELQGEEPEEAPEEDAEEEREEEPTGLGTSAVPRASPGPELGQELGQEFELDELASEEQAWEDDEESEEDEEPSSAADPEAELPRASWEQVGLFEGEVEEAEAEEALEEPGASLSGELTEELPEREEVEEAPEEAQPARSSKVETPTFDFEAEEPRRSLHEPEPPPRAEGEDPFAGPPGETRATSEAPDFVLQPAPAAAPRPAPRPAAAAKPKTVPKPEPAQARDEEGERWSQLVFDAGCAILEQKRVAVSMLERRFGIDFDQACRVLDELQAAGLIGPYMGGRTRDILLTREEWLSHAPHAS